MFPAPVPRVSFAVPCSMLCVWRESTVSVTFHFFCFLIVTQIKLHIGKSSSTKKHSWWLGTKFVNNQSFLWQIFWSPTLSQIYSEFSYKKPSLSWLERMQWYCICPTFDYIQNTDKYRCICSNRDKHSFQCELQTLFWDSVQSRSFRRPVNFFKHSNLLDFKWRHGTPCTSLYLV